ncbi:hypothetical protein H2200_002629 [Cladophialophora chaetospira]|uniref:PBSP domain protein n=1 Tax=Cladophialophora chaetospira TaxID=386627 RepID=A0AA38XJ87_9EURO|nr:hypothetical protein H2200_002629 [Cladophialophora chaetospira]
MAPILPPQLGHKPLLRLHIDDISHPAAQVASASLDSGLYLTRAIENVVAHLYRPYGSDNIPKYTTGLPLDDLHKEIHLSLEYVQGVLSRNSAGVRHELAGVITHEMVHCFQGNCEGTAPGGLIEGIADFVRLKAGLAPPHWNRAPENRGHDWDEGYQKTAWFLEWLEEERGHGTVSLMNETMRRHRYDEHKFWKGIFGVSVQELWKKYKETWEKPKQEDLVATDQTSSDTGATVEKAKTEEENKKRKDFVAWEKFVA